MYSTYDVSLQYVGLSSHLRILIIVNSHMPFEIDAK